MFYFQMEYDKEIITKFFIAVLMRSYTTFIFGQSNKTADKQLRLVFNQLIYVYGSANSLQS